MSAKVKAVGSVLQAQVTALRDYATADSDAQLDGSHFPTWYVPSKQGWSGNPFDLAGLRDAFSRKQHEEEMASVLKASDSPGTTGDMIASQLQGDLLASLERAYRSRLRTSVRNKIQAGSRRRGHGADAGVLTMEMLNYISRIIDGSNTQP